MVWHIGFPLTVIAYAILKNRETVDTSVAKGALIGSIAVFTTVAVLAAIATVGHAALPVIMQGNGYTPILVVVVASVWLFSLAALVVLLWQRRQTVLDLWLMVVMCAWLFDIALAALLNAGRFDLGFYAGRVYGLCAATFVLGVLLVEHSRLYARLLETHMKERLASQAKSRFLATMSHELRTPLNAIMGFTKVLLMKLPGPLTDAQEKQLTTVHGSAKHLLAVINDLLDVAKVEAGKIDFHPEPVDCRHLVQELGCSLRPLAERKGLRLDCRYGGTSEAVNTDKRVLTQILMNLVNNAIKYTHHGNVTVTCAQRAEGENFISEISVADTGIGIRKEDQAKLFDAFLRIPQEGAAESTGLGLYYSRKLADVIGARITFTSEFGKGSTFTVTLKGALRKG